MSTESNATDYIQPANVIIQGAILHSDKPIDIIQLNNRVLELVPTAQDICIVAIPGGVQVSFIAPEPRIKKKDLFEPWL